MNKLREVVEDIISHSGPWAMSDLISEVRSRVGKSREKIDWYYYIKKYVDTYERKNKVLPEDRVIDDIVEAVN